MTCAHPGCKCTLQNSKPYGNYCSEHCQQAGDKAGGRCECHHIDCLDVKA